MGLHAHDDWHTQDCECAQECMLLVVAAHLVRSNPGGSDFRRVSK